MMVQRFLVTFFVVFLIGAGSVHATAISHPNFDPSGSVSEYKYEAFNHSPASPIEEFTPYFEYDFRVNLSISIPPAVWDESTSGGSFTQSDSVNINTFNAGS